MRPPHRSQRKRFQKNRLSGGVSAAAAPPAHDGDADGDADGDGHSLAAAERARAAAWNERVRSRVYLRALRSPGDAAATRRRGTRRACRCL